MKKRLIPLLCALSFGGALAQSTQSAAQSPYLGGNITREYRAADLKNGYGILDVALGEIWVVTLPDDVVDVITSREGVLQFSQRGNRVIIGAIASTGSYPVLMMTADSVYFFQARLGPSRGGGVRNILVRADTPASPEQRIPGFPDQPAPAETPAPGMPSGAVQPIRVSASATVAPRSTPQVSQPAPQQASQVLQVTQPQVSPVNLTPQVTSPVTPAPNVRAPTVTSMTSSMTSVPVTAAASEHVKVDVDFRAITDGRSTRLYYRVMNRGSRAVTFDEAELTLRHVSGPVPFTTSRRDFVVAPGATEYGQVSIASVPSHLSAMWTGRNGALSDMVVRSVSVERLQ